MLRVVIFAVFLQLSNCISEPVELQPPLPPRPPAPLQQQPALEGKNSRTAFEAIEMANSHAGNLRMEDKHRGYLHEGDIKLSHAQRRILGLQRSNGGRQKRAAMRSLTRRWMDSNGRPVIPYRIEGSVAHARGIINAAMRRWMNNVPCLKFVPRTFHFSYVSFFAGDGCYSRLGRIGGKQEISIGQGCEYIHTVIHEIGHALGFWHEQSRPDRDNYVNIHWNNIPLETRSQFTKMSSSRINSRGVSYDYDSVMHYHSTAFGNGRITITRKDGSTKLGNTRGLSPKDIEQAKRMYCSGQPTSKPVTPKPPTGCQYKDANSQCPSWAGHCRGGQWKSFMHNYCKATCFCKGCQYKDANSHCPSWAGHCRGGLWKLFMHKFCKATCFCKDSSSCRDKHKNCPAWKQRGFCKWRYQIYMSANCKKSCGIC